LVFAAGCGVFGYWQGLGRGGEIIANIAASNQAYGAFSDLSHALDALDEQPGEYPDGRLRAALFELANKAPALQGWWACREDHPRLLERASAYLKAHPKQITREYDAYVARGLGFCKAVQRKAE
jgi:hypothetical protein